MSVAQRYHKLLEIITQIIPLPTSTHIHVTPSLSIKNNNNTTFHRPLELPLCQFKSIILYCAK